ncbi:MAG: 3-hydroxybutyryl-CoA dehydrogenase [Actinobacteria bacterium]|nr:3-hydroxybutyryl-CoA dehydrogenase [Actinomycetota bacterium]
MTLQKIGVVGCGLMGAGIAEVSARSGCDVVVVEATDVAAKSGLDRIEKSLEKAAQRGKLSDADVVAISKRLFVTHDFDALADRELVIEAVPEIDELKVDVFRRLSQTVEAADAILATNTSSIPIMKLAMATNRPEQVVGLHFFNPVPVLPLVEVVRSLLTSDDTARRVGVFAGDQLSKNLIQSQDRAGFIVNALLIPYILSAIRMFESGFASAEDIDNGMVHGCAHPMGPLALADLIGLDTTAAVAQSMYEEFKEPLYSAPPLLLRMVDAGLLGRKSGRGFYTYNR